MKKNILIILIEKNKQINKHEINILENNKKINNKYSSIFVSQGKQHTINDDKNHINKKKHTNRLIFNFIFYLFL